MAHIHTDGCFVPQIALRAVPALLEEVVAPGALELCAQLMDELGEMRETLQTQAGRLRELRVKKAQEPGGSFIFVAFPQRIYFV